MREELQRKVNFAIKLLQSAEKMAAKVNQPVEIAYSSGKDSDVILELAKMAGINYRAIYKNTTLDPPGTIKHALEMGAEIRQPQIPFFKLVEQMGFPNRYSRFCCRFLKEYKVLDYAVIGIRREESIKRSARYKEPETCRVFSKNNKVRQYLPILEWTSQDITEFIAERGIKCHHLYYDEDGTFHPERRLGCLCCALASHKNRIQQFKQNPGMVKAYLRAGLKFRNTHPNTKTVTKYSNVYEWFVRDVFFETEAKWIDHKTNMFQEHIDYKKYLEDYFGVNLDFA